MDVEVMYFILWFVLIGVILLVVPDKKHKEKISIVALSCIGLIVVSLEMYNSYDTFNVMPFIVISGIFFFIGFIKSLKPIFD